MAYSEKVIDHYENPRNVGKLDDSSKNVGTGMVGAPACGDVMRLQIRVNDEGIIEDAKFKTTEIAEELALPPVKIHCSVLAEDAIKAAVRDVREKQGK
jgi:nitrogen fixation NifU-like protein